MSGKVEMAGGVQLGLLHGIRGKQVGLDDYVRVETVVGNGVASVQHFRLCDAIRYADRLGDAFKVRVTPEKG